jgi:hypothetical protein
VSELAFENAVIQISYTRNGRGFIINMLPKRVILSPESGPETRRILGSPLQWNAQTNNINVLRVDRRAARSCRNAVPGGQGQLLYSDHGTGQGQRPGLHVLGALRSKPAKTATGATRRRLSRCGSAARLPSWISAPCTAALAPTASSFCPPWAFPP